MTPFQLLLVDRAATLLVPAIMYILVVYVTGIPPSEAQSLRRRGEDYRLYQQRTNAFFPGRPHQTAERAP